MQDVLSQGGKTATKEGRLLTLSRSEGSLVSASWSATRPISAPWEEDDPVLVARAGLKRALHSRRIAELEAAITAAELAPLYREELEQGRRALDMERKAAARARIKEAERARNVERWYAAVRDGQEVGLSEAVLADTLRELNAEEARIVARAKIRQAARESGEADVLAAALALGEQVGLAGSELSRARAVLASMEEKLDAQKAMNKAIASRDLGELERSLDRGLALYLERSTPFLDAQRALQEERQRIACRLELKDACLRKSSTSEAQMEDLRCAIERSETAGLTEPELARARGTLTSDERAAAAREKLRAAEQSKRLEELLAAIEEGEAAGLDASELAEARRLEVDAYKPAARERLKAAVASRDMEQLKAAISFGQEVGITQLGLVEAQETLAAEERKAKARAGLREAAPGREISKLFTAIKYGEGVGLEAADLAPYRVILEEEQRKAAARERLAELVELLEGCRREREAGEAAPPDLAPAREGLAEGEAAGLQAEELAAGRRALARAVEDEAIRRLASAVESRQLLELEAAVAAAVAGSVELEELLALLGEPPGRPELEARQAEAREALAVETRKARAREWVKEAERRRDLEELRAACREGEAVGLSFLEIRGAQTALAEEELRVPALQRLHEAVRSREVETLRTAIMQGDKAKLTRAELREARELLAVEEKKEAARAGLQRAQRGRKPRDLEAALAIGRASGLEEEELAAYEAVLADVRRSLARTALVAAEQSRSIPELQKCIRQAQRLGVESTAVDAATKSLAEERLQAARGSDAVIAIRTAIAEGERRVPESGQLPPARDSLTVAERREAAREALRAAEGGSDAGELAAAIKRGRREGLEEWELEGAKRILSHIRRVLSSKDETVRRVLLVPTGA